MKVSVIGVGMVGSTLAYALSMRQVCDELVLTGRTMEKARGDALDLQHADLFRERDMRIVAGEIGDTAGSEVVALCASRPWKQGFVDRYNNAQANVDLVDELVPALAHASPDAKIVVLSNPVDVLTYRAIQKSGFEPRRVMGTGTLIDSSRFRALLSEEVGIHPRDLRAYTLGEHGDTQFPAMSIAEAGGEKIDDTPARRALFEQARHAGPEVFKLKGYTNYAIASAGLMVIESILTDARQTMPLSVLVDGFCGVRDVCLSMPVVVGAQGVERWLHPELSEEESGMFRHCAAVVRDVMERTGCV